ncbi:hypothetical protein POJ06DRAFT_194033 [Lipomyces tetrasporus]|uniref:Uncharacterized protein n=1 Tax=Lipomyces tetrasporus TaxID=54092 RepID=A0AAD7VU97_9ASCO|nr:uncharacterized protein POJ06DRAFT_194033 [Lipomyces tetrasporus]KAJ8101801.1 hypothetical protein POJ06DRAFT_194033 [Lipomyces tetrasporus]
MARIKQLEQAEEKEHSHDHSDQNMASGMTVGVGVTRKRKRSAQPSLSPKHAEEGPNGHGDLSKSRQQSPATYSDRSSPGAGHQLSQSRKRNLVGRRTLNGVDHTGDDESEMSTDDDVDWLPPKLLLVRKFFRAREKELAKMSPDSTSSRDKVGTSEPVSPSDTDISSRKGSAITVKEERYNSPDVVKAKHRERDDRSVGSRSPVPSPLAISASTSVTVPISGKPKLQSPVPRQSSESPLARVSATSEAASGGPWRATSVSAPPAKSKSGPDLVDLFSDAMEATERIAELQARQQSPSSTTSQIRQATSAVDQRPALSSQSPPALGHPPPQQHIQPQLQSHRLPPTPPQGTEGRSLSPSDGPASGANGVKPSSMRVQLPPQSPFQLAPVATHQPGQIAPPLATPGSTSAAMATNPMHSPFVLAPPPPPSPATPSAGPTVQPPRPVKKLSFADYRKKQHPGGKEKEKSEEVKKD